MLIKSPCFFRKKKSIGANNKKEAECLFSVKMKICKNLQNSSNACQLAVQINSYLIKMSYVLSNNFFSFFFRSLNNTPRAAILTDLIYLNFSYGELDLKCLGL